MMKLMKIGVRMIKKTRKLIPAAILGIALSSVADVAQADARISVHIDNIGAVLGVSDHRNDVYFDVYDTNLLFIPALGYFVSYGSPFDILFLDNFYYLHRYGHWYRSSSYGGPWIVIQSHRLPSRIRKHPWKTIYQYRDREYRKHKQHRWLRKHNYSDRYQRDYRYDSDRWNKNRRDQKSLRDDRKDNRSSRDLKRLDNRTSKDKKFYKSNNDNSNSNKRYEKTYKSRSDNRVNDNRKSDRDQKRSRDKYNNRYDKNEKGRDRDANRENTSWRGWR
ncbi:hypothetical protein CR161_04485 [Prosthecochloris sp. ZM]|nr:hypothetical protein CR161_04485 [Prosthecochloris sp. ZM]